VKPASKPACPRLFEAEALRDGRLTGAEVARFRTHLGTCATCSHEMQAMQALADALRTPENSHAADELHVRRERTRLLAAFDASLMPAQRGRRWTTALAAVAALAVIATVALVVWRSRPLSPVAATVEPVNVRADGSAKWSRQTANERETLVLESGTLSIRVDHALPHRRLLVILPDGELEDIGTTFSVTADAGHTTRVAVQDGSVVLHLQGLPALPLRAGDAWSRAQPDAATPVPLATAQIAAPAASHTASAASARIEKAPPLATPVPSVAAPATDASADFRAAMSAFTIGDNTRASSLFATFLTQHPRDPRAEDAAYLRVLALQRTGNAASTKHAAVDYLSRYPHGFRHAEIEPLSR
jgi:TolA-binding protein